MYTYAQLESLRSRATQQLATLQTQLTTAKGQFTSIRQSLVDMGNEYGDWTTSIDDLLAASPDDPAVQALHAAKERIVAEFGSTNAQAEALETAVNQV